jgi:hypothetical protein
MMARPSVRAATEWGTLLGTNATIPARAIWVTTVDGYLELVSIEASACAAHYHGLIRTVLKTVRPERVGLGRPSTSAWRVLVCARLGGILTIIQLPGIPAENT